MSGRCDGLSHRLVGLRGLVRNAARQTFAWWEMGREGNNDARVALGNRNAVRFVSFTCAISPRLQSQYGL
jgi:hypothetical protein